MTDNIDYARFAGQVAFPRSSSDLASTSHCPACFTPLTSTVCSHCTLDLNHPAAAELYAASLATAADLDKRIAIIGRMRYETEQAAQAQKAAAEAAPPAVITAPVITAPEPSSIAPHPAPGRKHSSVQVTLLIVGVSLLSVAAIFFLVYAFINFGIIWRSVIIAAITAGAIAAASLLRRRGLTATAEGIAIFGVVLVYLDAFAIRANDFFHLASSDGRLFWGSVLILSSAVFIAWGRFSKLRSPGIVGFSVFAPGIGVLVAGLAKNAEVGTRVFLVAAAIAVAGLIYRFLLPPISATPAGDSGAEADTVRGTSRTVERVITLCTTIAALVVGFIAAFAVAPDSDWSGTISAIALVVIAAMHLWAITSASTAQPWRTFGFIFSALGAVFAASAVGIAAVRVDSVPFAIMAPPLAAVTVALLLEAIAVRGKPARKTLGTVAAWSATVVFAMALFVPFTVAVATALGRVTDGFSHRWTLGAADALYVPLDYGDWAVLTLVIIGVLAGVSWSATRLIRARGPILAWFGAGILVVAIALLVRVWPTMTGWLAASAIAVGVLSVQKLRAAIPLTYRAPLAALAFTAGILGYIVSWASLSTWWIGSVAAIVILVTARFTVRAAVPRAIFLGLATILAFIASSATAYHFTFTTPPASAIEFVNDARFVSILAVVLFAVFAAPLGRLAATADYRTMFWLSGSVAGLTSTALALRLAAIDAADRSALLLPEYLTSVVCSSVFVAAAVAWVAWGPRRSLRVEAAAAAIAVTPLLYLAIASLTRLLSLPDVAMAIAPAAAALLAAAVSLAIALTKPDAVPRWALDAGVGAVGIVAVGAAVLAPGEFTWLVLFVAAVAALLLAVSRDGLFASSSPRRFIGWAALALATAGLWWRLRSDDVANLEAYVLPLAASVLVIAVLLERAHRRKSRETGTDAKAAPVIALGGLLVGLLPLAVNASTGSVLRAVIVGAVAALLLLAGSFVIGNRAVGRWWDAAALAGGLGVLVLMVGRAANLEVTDASRDAWLVGGFVILIVAAFGQSMTRRDDDARLRGVASQAIGLIAMTTVLVMEVPAFESTPIGDIRVIGLVFLYCAVHVVAHLLQQAPFSKLVGWVGIAFAGIAALLGLGLEVVDTPELVTVPIAIALLVTGTMHMREVAAARSWLWLAPGLILLLVPTLAETFRDQALWRIVGLGVVGILVIIVGVARKLQAPFLIGAVVVLIHGISTFLPQLRAAYEFVPWWLWLGIGGALLVAVAVRFEQRRRDLKTVVMKFAELR